MIFGKFENLEDYNPAEERRVLIVFDDIIVDMECHKKTKSYCYLIVLREKKLNILLVFTSQSYFKMHKTIRLNATYFHNGNS